MAFLHVVVVGRLALGARACLTVAFRVPSPPVQQQQQQDKRRRERTLRILCIVAGIVMVYICIVQDPRREREKNFRTE